jgi:hypothetical protein
MINRIRSRGEAKKQIQDHREKETFDKTYTKIDEGEPDKSANKETGIDSVNLHRKKEALDRRKNGFERNRNEESEATSHKKKLLQKRNQNRT